MRGGLCRFGPSCTVRPFRLFPRGGMARRLRLKARGRKRFRGLGEQQGKLGRGEGKRGGIRWKQGDAAGEVAGGGYGVFVCPHANCQKAFAFKYKLKDHLLLHNSNAPQVSFSRSFSPSKSHSSLFPPLSPPSSPPSVPFLFPLSPLPLPPLSPSSPPSPPFLSPLCPLPLPPLPPSPAPFSVSTS
ncbi:unnamed protein product [Closterium sp. NIES-64]|nr:unnamed protein product [Closterium sp. NIES-64]